jgi:hypothetical protein
MPYSRAVDYDPLYERDTSDPDLDTLYDGVPPWMAPGLMRWLEPFLVSSDDLGERFPIPEFIEGLESSTRLSTPLDRGDVMTDVKQRIEQDPTFGMGAIRYALSTMHVVRAPTRQITNARLPVLEQLLGQSGSAWQVTELDVEDRTEGEKRLVLTRRDLAEAKLAISDIRAQDPRAGVFLADAWKAIATHDPRPSEAYDKAVKAVEVAAQPVVLPNNRDATLGQIISAMKAKPSKWTFALGELDLVIEMTDRVWTNHFRHGTQDRGENTLQEAEAAVHLAIPLVRFFVGGLVQPSQ